MKYSDEKLNQMKTKVNFDNIKSIYFLIKTFEYISKKKYLEIVKYNKKLQNRLKLSINDYKDYSQLYTSIEIELKLDNKNNHNKKFINISDENMKYYHIYFDNSKEEIKRTEFNDDEIVNKIKIKIDYHIQSLKNLFDECEYISSIYFKKFLRINVIQLAIQKIYIISLIQ